VTTSATAAGAGDIELEAALILRAQAGDTDAFGALVARHMRQAYFSAVGLVGSREDALDLSQEAFARAFRARQQIDPTRPFYAWYYTILRRLCFNG
jgi:RNA polymerase sigma-70 factor (ECF subfamily)